MNGPESLTGSLQALAGPLQTLSVEVVGILRSCVSTLACCESLTAGLVSAAVADTPGASEVLRGGLVTYATDLKHVLAGVREDQLAKHGPVHPTTARQMAEGARSRLRADFGLATTGVAGPAPQDGHPVGEVYVAVAWFGGTEVEQYQFSGDRATIRALTATAALRLLFRVARS